MSAYSAERDAMIERQLRPDGVHDERVIAAVGAVPRERFVVPARKDSAYADDCPPVADGRYLLRPSLLGRLLDAARLEPEDSVLELGCGNGYATAVLARLAARVTAVEGDARLADDAVQNLTAGGIENVTAVHAAPENGYAPEAPYDAIFINGGVEAVPGALFDQLKDGGRLVCVYSDGNGLARARLYTRAHGGTGFAELFDAEAPLLPGFLKKKGFSF